VVLKLLIVATLAEAAFLLPVPVEGSRILAVVAVIPANSMQINKAFPDTLTVCVTVHGPPGTFWAIFRQQSRLLDDSVTVVA
jgi:hypothetical protein